MRYSFLVQTMEGRKQKAREGKWNGGFAPYGYELVNGELQIAEDEAEIIRLIYDKFIHTNMGISATADRTEIISFPLSFELSIPSSTQIRFTPKSCILCKEFNTSAALRPNLES